MALVFDDDGLRGGGGGGMILESTEAESGVVANGGISTPGDDILDVGCVLREGGGRGAPFVGSSEAAFTTYESG